MTAFDKVIGYDNVKKELMMVCNMIQRKEVSSSMGAHLRKGSFTSFGYSCHLGKCNNCTTNDVI